MSKAHLLIGKCFRCYAPSARRNATRLHSLRGRFRSSGQVRGFLQKCVTRSHYGVDEGPQRRLKFADCLSNSNSSPLGRCRLRVLVQCEARCDIERNGLGHHPPAFRDSVAGEACLPGESIESGLKDEGTQEDFGFAGLAPALPAEN